MFVIERPNSEVKGVCMRAEETNIPGVYILEQSVHKDNRGAFVKFFQKSFFDEKGMNGNFVESYYTRSREDVIRGMHFQTPPYEHSKLVTVIQGTILDVVLDLRKNSPTYGCFQAFELSRENRKSIYIPVGCAHGFASLSEMAIAYYMVTSEYNPEFDRGIRYDSFGFDWPTPNPVVSDRDLSFPSIDEFISPF